MKPWYRSKTILGGLVSTVAALAALFGADISAALQGDIVDTLITLGAAIGAVMTIVGRIRARDGISLGRTPGDGDGSGTAAAVAVMLAVTLAPVLSACATPEAETPAQRVFAIQTDYTIAQTLAVAYIKSDQADPSAVDVIRQADAAAGDAIADAQAAVRAGDDPAVPALIAAAEHAVTHLLALVRDHLPTAPETAT